MNDDSALRPTRRRFLHTTAAAGVMLGCGGPGSQSSAEPFGTVSAGNIAELPVGTLRAVDGAPAYVGRDQKGVYAMTSTCPHAGCDMVAEGSVSASGVFCGCHGSRFDANGGVVRGPADSPLVHFAVTVDGSGNVTVEGGTQVSAAVRTAVMT
jgi:Rieske Fe-S protein